MEILIVILLVIIASLTVVTLFCLVGIYRSKDDGEKAAKTLADLVAMELIKELRTQRQETLAEARDQRREATEMAQGQRTELNEIIAKNNAQTAQLIQATSEATQNSLSGMQTAIRDKVDERLDAIQKSNEQKLDEMRRTVDEKLEATLNARLKNSFDIVSRQLESVNTRLGEMRSVAESVSNLNKTLSGSKTRGILGELQLSQIIEDMLPTQLYEQEAQMREGSRDRVEYAVKLPGQDEEGFVYLPIDSKFPLDDYYRLVDGFEKGDTAVVDESRKALRTRIKTFSASVREKYINPPRTTTFAVVFLPTEGLYAEAVRDATFFEELRKMGVMLAGPTTLSALLSSLLVGFKTLQIQKGAVEIQRTLEKTKTEFSAFGDVLLKAQTRIRQTGDELDRLVGARTRKINLALKNVQVYNHQGDEEIFHEIEAPEEEVFPEIETPGEETLPENEAFDDK